MKMSAIKQCGICKGYHHVLCACHYCGAVDMGYVGGRKLYVNAHTQKAMGDGLHSSIAKRIDNIARRIGA
jgi:hypothetical protein